MRKIFDYILSFYVAWKMFPLIEYSNLIKILEELKICEPFNLFQLEFIVLVSFKLPTHRIFHKDSISWYGDISWFIILINFFSALNKAWLGNHWFKILSFLYNESLLCLLLSEMVGTKFMWCNLSRYWFLLNFFCFNFKLLLWFLMF